MADAESRARLDERGVRDVVTCRCTGGSGRCRGGFFGGGVSAGLVARIDWARFLPLYQQAGRRAFLAELERELPDAAPAADSVREDPAGRAAHQCSGAATQEAYDGLPARRGSRGDTRRCRGDPRGRGVLRPRHGFVDGSRIAASHRTRARPGDASHYRDRSPPSDRCGRVPAQRSARAQRAGIKISPSADVSRAPRTDEPIAIVGLACRFPGAPDPEAFWDLLAGGVDAIREVPADRFDIDEFYDPDPETPGKMYTRFGGFLDGSIASIREFFGISPREALSIDPQQRLLLEMAWEALERAGLSAGALARHRTGVFVGVGANDYAQLLSAGATDAFDAYSGTGNALNAIAGRVSFCWVSKARPWPSIPPAAPRWWPSIRPCQACAPANATWRWPAASTSCSPGDDIAFSRARCWPPDGRCKTFDAAADGYVRGEGCGVIVLKRLSDAERDGDRILRRDPRHRGEPGRRASGLTVPNGRAQQRLIGTALARAGLRRRRCRLPGGARDRHVAGRSDRGPGGRGGLWRRRSRTDPAGRLGQDQHRPSRGRRGHRRPDQGRPRAAARTCSADLHFHKPTPHIPWARCPSRSSTTDAWPPPGRGARRQLLRFTGTNAHVVIEEAPAASGTLPRKIPADSAGEVAVTPESDTHEQRVNVLALSARSGEALVALAQRYEGVVADAHPEVDLADVCLTAGTGRSHFEHRAALGADSVSGCARGPGRVGREPAATGCVAWRAHPTGRQRRGCSPGRAASICGWPANCSMPSRFSPRP